MKLKWNWFGVLVLFILLHKVGCASSDVIFEHLSTEDGLSHGSVSAMLKDRSGFMWFATWDGINRYDGHSFKTFKPSNTANGYLASNRIESMKEDSLGNIWVMTYDSKLFRLNRFTEVFDQLPAVGEYSQANISDIFPSSNGDVWLLTNNAGAFRVVTDTLTNNFYVEHFDENSDLSLLSNHVDFLVEDAQRNIWISAGKGILELIFTEDLNKYSKKLFSVETDKRLEQYHISSYCELGGWMYFGTKSGFLLSLDKAGNQLNELDLRINGTVSTIEPAGEDLLFLGTSGKGIFEFNLSENRIRHHFVDPSIQRVLKMYPDSKGNIWVESNVAGISKINVRNRSFRHYEQKLNVSPIIRSNAQCGLMEDEHQTLWLTFKGGGFGYYNDTTDEVEYFHNDPDNAESKISNFVNCFYNDPSGVLWMSTYFKGIEKITFVDQKFQLVQPAPLSNLSLANEVRAMMQDSKGLLWMATKKQEVFLLDHNYKVVAKIDELNGQKIGLVYALLEDTNGDVYLGTKGNGLFRLHRQGLTRFTAKHYLHEPDNQLSLSNNNIYSIIQDGEGRIWIGTYGGGLNLKDEDRFIHNGNLLKKYPIDKGGKVRHIAEDRKGNIWMGTTNGIVFLNTEETEPSKFDFQFYNRDMGNAHGLGSNDVFWIFCDQQKALWMASLGGGLSRLLNYPTGNQSLEFMHLTKDDGLPSDVIFTITGDDQSYLWMSTENGISCYNSSDHVFRNFNRYDGIISSGFSEAAVSRRSDGSICFGANNGAYWFKPQQVGTVPKTIALEFTGFQLFGKEVAPGNDQVLKRSITETTSLQLKYNQNVLGISWAALDFKMQDKIQFDFKMEGYDTDWHTFSDQTQVNYMKLPFGSYEFKLRFSNPELQSVNGIKRLNIEILPPYWESTWAYIAYLIVTIFVVEFARRIITSMIRLRNNVLVEKELSNIKLNFFTNISHEFKTPLTLIIGPAKALRTNKSLGEKGQAYTQLIEQNAQRLLRLVNQLLDFRKIESRKMELVLKETNIIELVRGVCHHFDELAAEKEIQFRCSLPDGQLLLVVDIEKLDSVLFNLLSNAFKFTPDGGSIEVAIQLKESEKRMEIIVADHGMGISKEQEGSLFELFSSHPGSSSAEQRGSGIGLALSKELVQLHKGSLIYQPTDGGGATFIIQLAVHTQVEEQVQQLDQIAELENLTSVSNNQFDAALPQGHHLPKLLIVEDNAELRSFLRLHLSDSYRIEEAKNGNEGWLKAIELQPDLILSDIMMPEMDGIQLLDKIKHHFETSHIPVVLLTAKSTVESRIEGLNYGADAYLTKPFNNDQLKAQLENLLQQRVALRQRYANNHGRDDRSDELTITDRDAIFIKQVSEFIETNLSNTEFKITDLYQQLGMGRSKFSDKIKGLTGLSPIEYVMEIRLNTAHQILQSGRHNVSETSYLSGFTDAGYFSKCFKERFGVNPSQVAKIVS
ncbi:MAG: two-component regulator propeller domain-containing protein [Prolixibacteraceae bacterium]